MRTKYSTSMKIMGIPSCVTYTRSVSHGTYDTPEDDTIVVVGVLQKNKKRVYEDKLPFIERYDDIYPSEHIIERIYDNIREQLREED